MKAICVALTLLNIFFGEVAFADSWPNWRGDLSGSGRSSETGVPTEWTKEKNIKWRVSLPDAGNSTPIVHGDRVFLTVAEDKGKVRSTMCFDRQTGSLQWKKGVTYDKSEKTHPGNPYCSASPATDGEIVIAGYGSAGLVGYDFDGNEQWNRNLGAVSHVWGNSSSPLIYKNLCIHYHGPGQGGYLIALDIVTGKTVWKYDEPVWETGVRTDGFKGRDGKGVIGSFSTPIMMKTDGGKDELVMSFPMEIQSFDPLSGKKLWSCAGLNPLIYSSPISHGDTVVAMGGYYGNSIAVKAGGSGDVTETNRMWYLNRHNGGIGTGVMHGESYYYPDSGGSVFCLDPKTGEMRWNAKLPGSGKSWGSFTVAGDYIYGLSKSGETVVLKANPNELEVVAQNDLGEQSNSSLAISDGEIFLRTHEAIWCIANK